MALGVDVILDICQSQSALAFAMPKTDQTVVRYNFPLPCLTVFMVWRGSGKRTVKEKIEICPGKSGQQILFPIFAKKIIHQKIL